MLKKYLLVFFVSMVPLIELRGAIPYSQLPRVSLPLLQAYIVAVIGNMVPVPFIYLFARRVLEWGADKPVIGKFFRFCLEKGEKGGQKLQEKAGRGLFCGTASICRYSAAGHRRMDRNTRCQHSGYGF